MDDTLEVLVVIHSTFLGVHLLFEEEGQRCNCTQAHNCIAVDIDLGQLLPIDNLGLFLCSGERNFGIVFFLSEALNIFVCLIKPVTELVDVLLCLTVDISLQFSQLGVEISLV